jgi:hypothetical protein
MAMAAGSSSAAGSSRGPIAVYPSPPLDRTLAPLSAQRRSNTPRSFAAVTAATAAHASASPTRRTWLPITSAISPSKPRISAPAGSSTGPPGDSEVAGFRK